eukprot:CAMPEP_0116842216 /NCGR_PEP_ID=MMETSP0418-20121206/11388_1 /TAXON_ID=1158023 /ORGANISM="Astrosyne radiata, Strain 13vi08-1A" /LENGTH=471 /DNA_ID=CAMNT_0004472791 /DNA_START=29 /DNA_END=1444 /DNA_ORIENTATION=-
MKARRLTHGKSEKDILSLPGSTDENHQLALKILALITAFSYFSNQRNVTLFLSLEMLVTSLQRGLTKYSSFGFSVFGSVEGFFMRFDAANCWGRLALRLSERYRARECDCRLFVAVNSFLMHLQKPLTTCMEHVLKGYERGMENGDVQFSCLAASLYIRMYFISGLPLEPLLNDAASFSKQTLKYKQEIAAKSTLLYYQAALNLLGRSDDPVVLRGEAMDEADYVESAKSMRGEVHYLWMVQIQLAFLFEDMEGADARLQDLRKERDILGPSLFWVPNLAMFLALTAIEMIKRKGGFWYKLQARKYEKLLESWVKRKALNCQHKYLLVKAERTSLESNDPYEVKEMFDKAIIAATKSGFRQDAALANERAGKYWLERGNDEEEWIATDFLSQAHMLYEEWGAKAKAEQMVSKYDCLSNEGGKGTRTSFHHGRARYSSKPERRHTTFNAMMSQDSINSAEMAPIHENEHHLV